MRLSILLLLAACGTAESTPPAPEAPAEAPAKEAPTPAEDPASAVLVSGTITAPAELPEAQAVFVSLKVPNRRGPPLAAKKLPAGPFPMEFTITEADRPMVNGPVPETFEVKATLDVDGNAMSPSPEDLVGVVSGKKGATDLAVELAPRK